MSESAAPDVSVTKRIVVHIVKGRLAGLRRIVGHLVVKEGEYFPPRFDGVPDSQGQPTTVLHAGTFPRYVLYREWSQAATGALNDFHPEQT